jgi:pimeloyl-ACP methyl ester carboxylesterase
MGNPAGLNILERAGTTPGAPAVVLVHGSLDRGESFQRTMRRLPDLTMVTYDRRGYQGSRAAGVTDLHGHIADLLEILAEVRSRGASRVVAVGHSVGGDVVLGAALAEPITLDALGAFEPPMPWIGFRRAPSDKDARQGQVSEPGAPKDPGDEAERFFRRMVSAAAWERLSDAGRAGRRADGPALVADFISLRGESPFDVRNLAVPAVFGLGGADTAAHHRDAVKWLGAHVPGATIYEIPGAQHGAHLTHPDNFAGFIRAVLGRIPAAGTGETHHPSS